MANAEAEHPKTTAGPGLATDLAPEIPLSGTDNQLPSEADEAQAKSENESETFPAPPMEAGLSAPVLPGPHVQSEPQIPTNVHVAADADDLADEDDPAEESDSRDDASVVEDDAVDGGDPVSDDPVDAKEPEVAGASDVARPVLETASAQTPVQPLSPTEAAGEQAKPRSLFLALAATAIAGGILGFGGTFALRYFEGSQNRGGSDDRVAGLNARIDALEGKDVAAATAARTALAALESRVAATEHAASEDKGDTSSPVSSTALAALETRVAAAESAANKAADLANAAETNVQTQRAGQPAAQEPASGSNSAEVADLGPLNARIGAIEQKITSLESALAAPKAELRAHQQDRENQAAKQGDRSQAIAIVAESLLRKLDRDEPISGELAALENLGVPENTLASLRVVSVSPVSSERQLTEQFASLAPAIIANDPAKQASPDERFLDRVTRHAKDLVHIRRVGEGEAEDTEGLVERIEKALADHDLETAYKAWIDLPSPATKLSESWGNAAKARLDALTAARSVEADAVAAVGKSKS